MYELSVQLVSSLEDCIEMAGELQGARCPQAGFVFDELAEVRNVVVVTIVHAQHAYTHMYMFNIIIVTVMNLYCVDSICVCKL